MSNKWEVSQLFNLLIIVMISGLLSWLATYALRRSALRLKLVDMPGERSSHVQPTPRGGGLSFVVVSSVMIAVTAFLLGKFTLPGVPVLILGSQLVAFVSLADDRWHLPVYVRIGAHSIGALVLVLGAGWIREVALPWGGVLSLGWLGLPFTLIWIVGLTNAYNFMDGIDGLAGGQAVIAAGMLAWLSCLLEASQLCWFMAIICGSVFGFLIHNWPPARIFMGDVGSAYLGYTFAGWAVLCCRIRSGGMPFFAWVILLAPFLLDTSVTLISRVVRGQRWYEAHREHFYQRLIRQDWSHLAVTSLYLCVTAFLGFVTIAFYGYSRISVILFAGMVVIPLAGIVLLVRWIEFRSV
jgi:UDP-N-acetylmuramyl pentapeptide phosphotransferase/UDP-N-acetylglucosamine-1-phosphate transferase